MAELPEPIYLEVTDLCARGDELLECGDDRAAIEQYQRAWDLLPEPRTDWSAATWILTAIADAHFLHGRFAEARDALLLAMHCPDAVGNPFLHLRLGQSCLELGDQRRAADELARAYMAEGTEIFDGEDPKYFQFVQSVLKPPKDGW